MNLEIIRIQNVKWCMKQLQFKEYPIQHMSSWHNWMSIKLLSQWWSAVSSILTGVNFIFLSNLSKPLDINFGQKYNICIIYCFVYCFGTSLKCLLINPYLCLVVVTSWSLTQQVAGLNNLILQKDLSLNSANSVKTFRENSSVSYNRSADFSSRLCRMRVRYFSTIDIFVVSMPFAVKFWPYKARTMLLW